MVMKFLKLGYFSGLIIICNMMPLVGMKYTDAVVETNIVLLREIKKLVAVGIVPNGIYWFETFCI